MFSAQYGWWNECQTNDKAFVTALKNLCKANMLAMQAILKVQPEAYFIQSESSEYFHAENPGVRPLCDFLNHKRFLSLDLTFGHSVDVTIYKYLLENGMTDKEYNWFGLNHSQSTRAHQDFLKTYHGKTQRLQQQHPHIDLSTESNYFSGKG